MKDSFEGRNSEFNKLRFKKSNSTIHFRKHSDKRVIDNLSVRSLASLKREFDDATRLHLHIRTTTEIIDGYSIEYCIVFYFNIIDCLNRDMVGQRDLKPGVGSISGEAETIDFTSESNNLDESMFIGTINISEKRQRRIPCLIWLQTLNE